MTTTYPSPSNCYKLEHGQYISWFLKGRWIKFKILGDSGIDPSDACLIGHAVDEDHLEELYQLGDRFFRNAGGGRGFYWTQELEIVN